MKTKINYDLKLVVPYHRSEKTNTMKSSNRNKLLILPSVALFVLLLGVLSINAAVDCNLTVPTIVNKQTQLNVSYNISANVVIDNVTVAFQALSALTPNTSFVTIANVTNNSAGLYTNISFSDRILLPDATTYSFRAICQLNASGDTQGAAFHEATSATVTATLDRSIPSIQGLRGVGTDISTNLQTIEFGVTNATQWRFWHNSLVEKTTTVTSDFVNTSGNHQISLRDSGNYYLEVSDGLNLTNSSTVSYTLSGGLVTSTITKPSTEQILQQQQQELQQQKKKGGMILLITFIIIFVSVIGYAILRPRVRRR